VYSIMTPMISTVFVAVIVSMIRNKMDESLLRLFIMAFSSIVLHIVIMYICFLDKNMRKEIVDKFFLKK
ncbi:hypothetical protein, partial [Intestinibacter sp.]|uniref:hypothetical protein n=1 Tax=Intestinibacter sp. TaxID=1965304 RepID=UPI002A754F60